MTPLHRACSALQEAGIVVTIAVFDSTAFSLRLTIPETITCVVPTALLLSMLEQSNSLSEFVESVRLEVLFNE